MDFVQVDIIGLSTSPSSGGAYALVLVAGGGGGLCGGNAAPGWFLD